MIKARSPKIAAFASFVCGGLGQIYNGQLKKALCLFVWELLLVVAFVLVYRSFAALVAVIVLVIGTWVWNVIDAARSAGGLPNYELRKWNRWYFYIAYVVAVNSLLPAGADLKKDYMEAFKIPSSSMSPTLQIGDHFVVDKSWYRDHSVAHGDIVVLETPEEAGVNVVKRVVGLPGDRVELHGLKLSINGNEIAEPYAYYVRGGLKDFGPETVPEHSVFLLGDNRDQSKDARYWMDANQQPAPFLDIEKLKGKALYLYWSSTLEFSRIGKSLD